MHLKDVNPFIRQALIGSLNSSNKKDTFNELQAHDCRLFFILSDYGNIIVENKRYHLHYGSIILFQSATKYTWEIEYPHEIKYLVLNFDYTHNFKHITKAIHPTHSVNFDASEAFEHIVFEDAEVLNSPIVLPRLTSFENRLRLIVTEFYNGDEFCDELLSSVLKSLIIHIVRILHGTSNDSKKERDLTSKIIEYIQNNYTKPISNIHIADYFHINPIYMNRIFKKQIGTSLHAFVLNYRLNAAMVILRSSSVSVQETAQMVGFQDPVHFNKIFKKHIGTTPNQYRRAKE
ncbi:MAG: AraC family transcriptional regulator [Clostridia bacterium]|nr:AraC family transcriptional regulator [Clostridia bacterium]